MWMILATCAPIWLPVPHTPKELRWFQNSFSPRVVIVQVALIQCLKAPNKSKPLFLFLIKEFKSNKKMFKMADKNKDGFLEGEELLAFYNPNAVDGMQVCSVIHYQYMKNFSIFLVWICVKIQRFMAKMLNVMFYFKSIKDFIGELALAMGLWVGVGDRWVAGSVHTNYADFVNIIIIIRSIKSFW